MPNYGGAMNSIIKSGVLCKRSIFKKKAFGAQNYKHRLFELTEDCLNYYDGDAQNKGRLKGSVQLVSIKVVMEVEDNYLEGRSNVFQIVYEHRKDFPTLYVIADSPRIQKEWITAIRDAANKAGALFLPKYHPGVWTKKLGYYNCCNQCDRNAVGCKCDSIITRGPPPPIPPPRPETAPPKTVVIAIYDYEPTEVKDLELIQGDKYTVIDDSAENWWIVENAEGKQGYIPANYVKINCGLEVYEWYYKGCSREASKQILMASRKEGCFLVRDSVSSPGDYTLSIFTSEGEGNVRHYQIKLNEMKEFYIAKNHTFKSIPDLIHYHKHNAGGIHTRLREPPPRGDKPSTAGFGYGQWELDPRHLSFGNELGRGCFGVVYQGTYQRGMTSYPVAIKEMPVNPASDEFLQEFKTMTQLSHPNIVQLYGVIVKHDKHQQIVTELLVNGALNNYLRRNREKLKTDQNQLLDYCAQVCNGMEYLDKKNIIHRDLAARNCLVGPNENVKVGDFGLARMVLNDDEYQMSDGSKFPFKWAPPEVLHHRIFSSKSDVWAYGILMWEIYSFGDMPYQGMKNADVAKFVAEEKKRLSSPRAAPKPIYDLMRECWQEVPSARPIFTEIKAKLSRLNAKGNYMPT